MMYYEPFDKGYLDDDTAYEAKVYQRPSFWGIKNSRISKLWIYKRINDEWECTYEYDRGGEDGTISDEDLNKLLELYPERLPEPSRNIEWSEASQFPSGSVSIPAYRTNEIRTIDPDILEGGNVIFIGDVDD